MKRNQKTRKKSTIYYKILPWNAVAEDLARRSQWKLVENLQRRKVFDRGNERIVAVRFGPTNWKAEHFVAGKLVDSSGMADEEFVKRIIYEMGIFS